jgi:hypothetical protein
MFWLMKTEKPVALWSFWRVQAEFDGAVQYKLAYPRMRLKLIHLSCQGTGAAHVISDLCAQELQPQLLTPNLAAGKLQKQRASASGKSLVPSSCRPRRSARQRQVKRHRQTPKPSASCAMQSNHHSSSCRSFSLRTPRSLTPLHRGAAASSLLAGNNSLATVEALV